MHVANDPGVSGLILANPWVRTDASQARAQVRHYYGQRVMQRAFWSKLFTERFDLLDSLRGFIGVLRDAFRSTQKGDGDSQSKPPFLSRMERGATAFRGPTLLLLSDDDLTAREFDGLCGSSPTWSAYVAAQHVSRVEILGADHTFSAARTLNAACDRPDLAAARVGRLNGYRMRPSARDGHKHRAYQRA